MNGNSRTAKSLKNSSVALIFYFVNFVLQFFSRKIFLQYLGTEILGLNTTATNLLQFLNLAELGIGSAVGFSLYRPLYEKDTQTINEIVALQGKLYRKIAYIVISGAAVLMCFFPWIFSKMALPLWYAYASFGVLLFSALLSYFVNYKQIILSADQKGYLILYTYKVSTLTKVLVQILAVSLLPNGYVWWLILEVIFAIVGSCTLNYAVKHTYPFLTACNLSFRELSEKYSIILTKIKQFFFRRISEVVLNQMSPIIIYGFVSMTAVAVYGNYMLIILGLYSLVAALSNGLVAGIGNLVAEGNLDRILTFFEELFSTRFFVSSVMCFGFLTLAQPFISLWIGSEYLLPTSTLYLLVCFAFLMFSRQSVDDYLYAYGIYYDIWAPITEALLNIGCSVLFGYYWGLNGVLIGVIISLLIIPFSWKPYFLFHVNLKRGLKRYIRNYIIHALIAAIVVIACIFLLRLIPINPYAGYGQLLLYGTVSVVSFAILLGLLLYLTGCGLKHFMRRIHSIIF